MNHKLCEIQFRLASYIQTACNKVLSVVLESKTSMSPGLKVVFTDPPFAQKSHCLDNFSLVRKSIIPLIVSPLFVITYPDFGFVCAITIAAEKAKMAKRIIFLIIFVYSSIAQQKTFWLLIFSLIEYITSQCAAQFKD